MKRIACLFFTISIIYSTSIFAQIDSIPNSDFEILQDFTDTTNLHVGSTLWVDDISLEISSGISIDINPRLKTNIYPNPAKDHVNLEFEEAVENAELLIFDINGTEVYNKNCCFGRKYSINTESFKSETYYFHLMLGNQRLSSGIFKVVN